ncbi:DUF86 domain-containing protein [Candidatus Micrarchaeota archaeon]|nr:DUF86 domain-containing protein [Candidatus Micrarchaeota archaeon]
MKDVNLLIRKIKEHVNDAKTAYAGFREKSDKIMFNNLAMECFQACNYIISLAGFLIEKKSWGYPTSYSEMFRTLNERNIISENELKGFLKIISLRNRIAHEYYEIDKERLLGIYSTLVALEKTIEKIGIEAK